jgi:hypothetical protein
VLRLPHPKAKVQGIENMEMTLSYETINDFLKANRTDNACGHSITDVAQLLPKRVKSVNQGLPLYLFIARI